MKVEELETMIKELETSLHRSTMESDRKMTRQQQEYEKKIQILMRQLSETATGFAEGDGTVNGNSTSGDKDAKYVSATKSPICREDDDLDDVVSLYMYHIFLKIQEDSPAGNRKRLATRGVTCPSISCPRREGGGTSIPGKEYPSPRQWGRVPQSCPGWEYHLGLGYLPPPRLGHGSSGSIIEMGYPHTPKVEQTPVKT